MQRKTTLSEPDHFTDAELPPRLLDGSSSWQIFHPAR
jgi:hypothetical protein